MKNLFIILFFSIFLTGCSFLPRLTFDSPGTVPEKTTKGKTKEKCKGKIIRHTNGEVKSCSRGYYNYEESFNKEERKMTIIERIKSFINNLAGWSFWIFVILIIFAPGFVGLILGKLIEGSIGVTGRALKSTAKAIKNAKRNGGDFMGELRREHDKDKGVKKRINKLRVEE